MAIALQDPIQDLNLEKFMHRSRQFISRFQRPYSQKAIFPKFPRLIARVPRNFGDSPR